MEVQRQHREAQRRAARLRIGRRGAALALLLAGLAGCATSAGPLGNPFTESKTPEQQALELEPMLEAAGFAELPAENPAQIERLKALPALELSYYDRDGARHYWLSDPQFCKCLFHGDEAAYQRYENIELQNQLAERDRRAVEMQQLQQQQMMMGPPGFGMGGFGGGGSGISIGGGSFGFSF